VISNILGRGDEDDPHSDNVSVIILGVIAASMLREARRLAGLSQRELARRADIPQPAISRIERGHGSPQVETLDRLLRACGKELQITERRGLRVDRTLIRERLRLSPRERARLTVREWERTAAFRRSGSGEG
jgi:transcriptional regulator with XRE-family HTH domain